MASRPSDTSSAASKSSPALSSRRRLGGLGVPSSFRARAPSPHRADTHPSPDPFASGLTDLRHRPVREPPRPRGPHRHPLRHPPREARRPHGVGLLHRREQLPGRGRPEAPGRQVLGAVCEGVISDLTDVWINDRPVLSGPLVDQVLGTGTGTKKEFPFPHRWVYLGDDENPAVEVRVDGGEVLLHQVWDRLLHHAHGRQGPDLRPPRDDKRERILEGTVRVYLWGPGYPEVEQLRRAGLYRWGSRSSPPTRSASSSRRDPPRVRGPRHLRLPRDRGLGFAQDLKGNTRVVFGAAREREEGDRHLQDHPLPGPPHQVAPRHSRPGAHRGIHGPRPVRNPRETLSRRTPPSPTRRRREVDDLRVGIVAAGFIYYKDDGARTRSAPRSDRVPEDGRCDLDHASVRLGDGVHAHGREALYRPWEIGLRTEWKRLFDAGDVDAADKLEAFDRAAYEVRATRLDKPAPIPSSPTNFTSRSSRRSSTRGSSTGDGASRHRAMPSEFLSEDRSGSPAWPRGEPLRPEDRRPLRTPVAGRLLEPIPGAAGPHHLGRGRGQGEVRRGFFFTGMDFFLVWTGGPRGRPRTRSP